MNATATRTSAITGSPLIRHRAQVAYVTVTSRPTPSIAVHCNSDGHATPVSEYALVLVAPNAKTPPLDLGRCALV